MRVSSVLVPADKRLSDGIQEYHDHSCVLSEFQDHLVNIERVLECTCMCMCVSLYIFVCGCTWVSCVLGKFQDHFLNVERVYLHVREIARVCTYFFCR
jgi:hypothetical protein